MISINVPYYDSCINVFMTSKHTNLCKNLLVLLAALLVIIGIVLINNSSGTIPENNPLVTIGFVTPLSGPFAEWGTSIRNGMEIALKETKHQFRVNYEDDVCDPKNAVTIANKLFSVDKIKIIIGPGCIDGLKAVAPLAEQHKALLFSTGLLDDGVFTENKNVINLANQISTEARYLAAYLKTQPIKKVAIVHGTNLFGEELGNRLPDFLNEYSIMVTSTNSTSLDETDFKTIILSIFKNKPDAIFIHQGEVQIGTFAKQLRELGHTTQVFSYYGTESQSVLKTGGNALEGVKYTYPVNSEESSPGAVRFEQRYAQRFPHQIPSATSRFIYDGMILLDQALDTCGSENAKCIAFFFKHFGTYRGISGDMTFNNDGSITRPFGIKEVRNGKFEWVEKRIEL